MLHWSSSPLWFRRPLFLIASAVCFLAPSAKAPTPSAKHGLTGSYYIGAGQWDKDTPPTATFSVVQIWSDANDFNLPRTFTAPAATRVDAQVAFGEGKGFHAKEGGPAMTWWPTGFPDPLGWKPVGPTDKPWDNLATVIWKGYIHLPKAGTYYFGTISNGPSAVYLNQARVALNGLFGGVLVSDAFTYAKEDRQELVQNLFSGREDVALGSRPRDTYAVPVSIDAPRDLPIEVQYNPTQHFSHAANEPFGIDLFWVTPDSPREANGKPIAKIVPREVLYTVPPATIEKPTVRSANSTIEADHLYVSGAAALRIRLADKDGDPIAGKRVHVNSLTSYGGGDSIVQPDKPTDEKGETKAIIRAGEGSQAAHDSTIFATDVTDFVDVAQVAHITFQRTPGFFADAFAPYYDQRFSITPLPPVVGRPAVLKTVLTDQSESPARVTVTFLTTDWNIGLANWVEIARVQDIALQPGESKEVSTTFTPKEVMGHKCYKVEVEGEYVAMNPSGGKVFAASLLPLASTSSSKPISGSQQINTSTVAPQSDCKDACQTINDMLGLIKEYDASICPGPCADFTNKFDPLLHGLRDVDLPCCFNAGADPTCASLLQQIHRDRLGLKTLNSSIMFPSSADCFSGTPARCDDYNAIQRIQENLNRLGGILGCVAGKHQPHLACPEMKTLETIKEHVERDEKLTHFLSEHARKNDPELTKGLEQAETNFGTLAAVLGKLIKLGKTCDEIKKILSELQAFFIAIQEINNAGCNSQLEAKGFDDLAKSAAALAGNLPLINLDPELAGIVSIFAQDQHFFENMSCALNPECRWRREFQSVDGYIPNCQSAMSSPSQ